MMNKTYKVGENLIGLCPTTPMKSKINFKILYLVLTLTSSVSLFFNIEYFFFEAETIALISFLNQIDVSNLSPPKVFDTTWAIILLVFQGVLFFIFGKLFLNAKEKLNPTGLNKATVLNLTWLFLSYMFIAYIGFGYLKIVLFLTFIVIAIVKLRKASTPHEEVQDNEEYNIQSVRLDYMTLFNTMLALIIVRTLIDVFTTILFNKSHPHPFITKSSIDIEHLIVSGLIIVISLLIFFVHDKFKHHISNRFSSLHTFVYGFTLAIFSLFFLLDWYIIGNMFSRYFIGMFFEKSVAFLIVFPLLAFFYFRKGRVLEKQGASLSHMAFSAFLLYVCWLYFMEHVSYVSLHYTPIS